MKGIAPHTKADIAESLSSTISEEDEMTLGDVPITAASDSLANLVKLALRKTVKDRPNNIPTLMATLNEQD